MAGSYTLITQRHDNNKYAPGIATYGIDGKNGTSGSDGTSVFITCYNIPQDVTSFGEMISKNGDPTNREQITLTRKFIEGDSFLCPNGLIFKIVDLEGLIANGGSQQVTEDNYKNFLQLVGSIQTTSNEAGFDVINNRLTLDTKEYQGFVINNAGTSKIGEITNLEAPFVIMSTDADHDNKVSFISLKTVYSSLIDSEFDIYYDSNLNAYVLKSDKPIVIDGDVQVNQTSSESLDEYSPIMTIDNPLASFKTECSLYSYVATQHANPDGSATATFRFNYPTEYTEGDVMASFADCLFHVVQKDPDTKKVSGEWFIPSTDMKYESGMISLNVQFVNPTPIVEEEETPSTEEGETAITPMSGRILSKAEYERITSAAQKVDAVMFRFGGADVYYVPKFVEETEEGNSDNNKEEVEEPIVVKDYSYEMSVIKGIEVFLAQTNTLINNHQ